MIIGQVNGLATLNSLIEAFPFRLMPLFQVHFLNIVPVKFAITWPEEFRQYAYMILLLQRRPTMRIQEVQSFITDQLEGLAPRKWPVGLPKPLGTLTRIVSLMKTIDFFFSFFTAFFLSRFPEEKRVALSAGEDLRLRRALLRFQLYTQIFHQPGITEEVSPDRDWEDRPSSQYSFWTRFAESEAEECKCIYVSLTRSTESILPLVSMTKSAPSAARGLHLLQNILIGAPLTPLEVSYTRSFVEHARRGLEPLEVSYAQSLVVHGHREMYELYPSYWSDEISAKRIRRYEPSPCHGMRNWNWGRQQWFASSALHTIDRRARWRLAGYCFWDKDRLDFPTK